MRNAKSLALRVTLNSVVMIGLVYLVMQSVVFFRDGIILQTGDLDGFVTTVFGFIGGRVLPPLVLFGALLYLIALPIQRVAIRLAAGEPLTEQETEQTRTRLLGFGNVVLAINLTGFLVGFFLDLVLGNKLAELTQLHRIVIMAGNITASFSYAAAQSALNNGLFAELRDQLKITAVGKPAAPTAR